MANLVNGFDLQYEEIIHSPHRILKTAKIIRFVCYDQNNGVALPDEIARIYCEQDPSFPGELIIYFSLLKIHPIS